MRVLDYPAEVTGILSFDFDGTLFLAENEVVLEPIFYQTIETLREDGWLWAINTGRSLLHMLEGFEQSSFPFSPDFLVAREREIYVPGNFGIAYANEKEGPDLKFIWYLKYENNSFNK